MSAQSVAWWPVHEYVTARNGFLDYPMAGTPEWCALADDDERKLAAVLDAGQHHVLRVEVAQEALAEASKAIAKAADWPQIAREIRNRADARRSGVRIERVSA